jgi:hypothetical protein
MASLVGVQKSRAQLNAALCPVTPRKGQFYDLCVCVGFKPTVHYYLLARGYSIVCGPPPASGVISLVGTHNSLVRALLRHFHSDLDEKVFVPFNTTRRLKPGKQNYESAVPVWDDAQAPKAHSLSSSFLRDEFSFKFDYAGILYDSSESSWFNSSDSATDNVHPDVKRSFSVLRNNVLEYSSAIGIEVVPPKVGEWWVSFVRDAVVTSPASQKRAKPSFHFEEGSFSFSSAVASAGSGPSTNPVSCSARASSIGLCAAPEFDFSRDRPRYAECVQQAPILEDQAVRALSKPKKAASIFDCNALGFLDGGGYPRYALVDQWDAVVDARKAVLKDEASRRSATSSFIFNALGRSEDGETLFQFCTNYHFQREAFCVDEITPISVTAYDNKDFIACGDDMRKDITKMRSVVGKRSLVTSDLSEEEVRAKYKKVAKKINKEARREGTVFDIMVSKHGEILLPESP